MTVSIYLIAFFFLFFIHFWCDGYVSTSVHSMLDVVKLSFLKHGQTCWKTINSSTMEEGYPSIVGLNMQL